MLGNTRRWAWCSPECAQVCICDDGAVGVDVAHAIVLSTVFYNLCCWWNVLVGIGEEHIASSWSCPFFHFSWRELDRIMISSVRQFGCPLSLNGQLHLVFYPSPKHGEESLDFQIFRGKPLRFVENAMCCWKDMSARVDVSKRGNTRLWRLFRRLSACLFACWTTYINVTANNAWSSTKTGSTRRILGQRALQWKDSRIAYSSCNDWNVEMCLLLLASIIENSPFYAALPVRLGLLQVTTFLSRALCSWSKWPVLQVGDAAFWGVHHASCSVLFKAFLDVKVVPTIFYCCGSVCWCQTGLTSCVLCIFSWFGYLDVKIWLCVTSSVLWQMPET